MRSGIELADQYNIIKNELNVSQSVASDLREQLKAKEAEVAMYQNKIDALRQTAPNLIKELEKEFEHEME